LHPQHNLAKNPARFPRHTDTGVGDGGRGARAPLNSGKKIIFGQFYVKFGHFRAKNHVKLENFVNFSGKYNKKSGIVIIFRARNM